LLADIGWQNWSSFGQTTVGISAATQKSVAADLNFSDTIHLACGEQYRIAEKWLWSAGFAYDSAPVSEANRLPTLPLDRNLRFGTGIQYTLNDDVTLGAAYEYLNGGDAPFAVNRGPLAGRVQGDFSSNVLNFVGVNLNWKL
jgi:long-chain fatty acid transport protein